MKRVRELQKLQQTNLNPQLTNNNYNSYSDNNNKISTSTSKRDNTQAIHGISINCFSYNHKVHNADHHKLLYLFLKRFAMSVNNSLQIIDMSTLTPDKVVNELSSATNRKQTSLEVNEML